MAVRIRDLWTQRPPVRPVGFPDEAARYCERLDRLRWRARQRGWRLAEERLRVRLRRAVAEMHDLLGQLVRELNERPAAPPRAAEILSELQAVDGEFDDLRYDGKQDVLSVVTEEIVLEDVDLGAFRIELDVAENDLRVEALDPNAAATRGSFVHPHVEGNRLCLGEGALPLRAALAAGRLLDAIHVVSAVLRTYYPESAFVQLHEWDGVTCHGCGANVPRDERDVCRDCEVDLCEDCSIPCNDCGFCQCDGCISTCTFCGAQLCSECVTGCPNCDRTVCRNCLDDEGECPKCQGEVLDRNSDAATDALRLGKADSSA